MRLEVLGQYDVALSDFRAGNFIEARKRVEKLRLLAPGWSRILLLEAYIHRAEDRYVTEIRTLERFLAAVDNSERRLAADAWSLLGAAKVMLGEVESGIRDYQQAAACELDIGRRQAEISNVCFAANYIDNLSAAQFQHFFDCYETSLPTVKCGDPPIWQHEKLHIGYLSANFREHPLAFFLWPLLQGHDRDRFEVYCYAAGHCVDTMTGRLQSVCDCWRSIGNLADHELALQIRQDEIDILVELDGHTAGTRLSVLRYHPALVQLSGIGYMGSTGIRDVQYFLSDPWCMAAAGDAQKFFREKLISLPTSHLCYAALKSMPPCQAPPCLHNGYITFGCFNNFSKVTDEMLSVWAKLLLRLPTARLLLKHRVFDSEEGRRFIYWRMEQTGLPLERVDCQGFSKQYLQDYNRVDIALDTYPYTGGLTTCEALYMGVPVISRYGVRPGSCFGRSLLENVGLGELAVSSVKDYIDRAVGLAADWSLLTLLHEQLRSMMQRSPLMDETRYVHEVEKLYQVIWMKKGRI